MIDSQFERHLYKQDEARRQHELNCQTRDCEPYVRQDGKKSSRATILARGQESWDTISTANAVAQEESARIARVVDYVLNPAPVVQGPVSIAPNPTLVVPTATAAPHESTTQLPLDPNAIVAPVQSTLTLTKPIDSTIPQYIHAGPALTTEHDSTFDINPIQTYPKDISLLTDEQFNRFLKLNSSDAGSSDVRMGALEIAPCPRSLPPSHLDISTITQ
ncbi:hypothetical protein DFH08DRAFT_828334 [Mycena albidolilacea]|uniref:Uncharacterized protein n=1 Tax=Mycena albidolilacea TaxID=1033008 RepID=A0AAD7E711_9AGAR|nr:hypothetical protein DFH08DRAFT_828334 [Mycena albidolilacea]